MLRDLLDRLAATPDGWRTDPDAERLLVLCGQRYAALARKHGQTPADAMTAAFEVLRTTAVRRAEDPWAVVTVAVHRTLVAEQRACGLLISPARARKIGYDTVHDPERFSDRAVTLADHHPTLQTTDPDVDDDAPVAAAWVAGVGGAAVHLLIDGGWPAWVAGPLVELVCGRTAEIGSRTAAYEELRRDKTARSRFALTHATWVGLLRTLLGDPALPGGLGQGVLYRLVGGATIADLTADPVLSELIRRCVHVPQRMASVVLEVAR